MNVVLLSNDLMTQSKVGDGCRIAGMEFKSALTVSRLLESISATTVVVLDLAMQNYDVVDAVSRIRSASNPPRAILAFGPHVHEARLQSASDAGCDAVFARGQFFAQAATILQSLA